LHHVAEWKTQSPRSMTAPCWMPPPTDTIKINVYGSFIPELLAGGGVQLLGTILVALWWRRVGIFRGRQMPCRQSSWPLSRRSPWWSS
jgi:hypothetical protein